MQSLFAPFVTGQGQLPSVLQGAANPQGNNGSALEGGTAGAKTGTVLPEALTALTRQFEQLRFTTQGHTDLLSANTQAISQNTAAQSKPSGLSNATSFASGLLGNTLSFLPLVSGITKLFQGGGASPAPPLPKYSAPPALNVKAAFGTIAGQTFRSEDAGYDQYGLARITQGGLNGPAWPTSLLESTPLVQPTGSSSSAPAAQTATERAAPQITVQVQAMDSRSFLDRSHEIAQAVREAMLNMHSINDVVADL